MEDIKVVGIILEDITKPSNDGRRGSALYAIPFALSGEPSAEWEEFFIRCWNHPSSYSTRHRPGIARIEGDRLILDGTTIEEVEQVHQATLQLVLSETNRQYSEWRRKQERHGEYEKAASDEWKSQVSGVSKRIKF